MAESKNMTRREAVKVAGAATIATMAASGPLIRTAKAADGVKYGMIGTGSRGTYLLKHLKSVDSGQCVAICDITDDALDKAQQTIGGNPKRYKDWREMLADKNVDAVFVTTPLYLHFPATKDALEAGKHVFCEKSLVFKPEEVHALRALVGARPKQVLQTGLQRRYSEMYQAARNMVEKGLLGDVTYVQAQWHRNPGWKMKEAPNKRMANWRLFREYSGGLVAELASHQIDVADWMLGMTPESVVGLGSRDFMNDGRDILDNIQLIYKYPKGRRLVWTGVPGTSHWAGVGGARTEMGEIICGTQGSVHITIGDDNNMPIGMWFREPNPPKVEVAKKDKKEKYVAGATMIAAAGSRPLPILLSRDLMTGKESFLEKEMKFARLWLYQKGILVPEEPKNPVDTELEAFFNYCKSGGRPKADLEIGLADSTAVILSNIALDEGRMVQFSEIDKMGRPAGSPARPAVKHG